MYPYRQQYQPNNYGYGYQNYQNNGMPTQYHQGYSSGHNPNQNQNQKRRSKEGDWICMRCANYNYAFRNICNRCKNQTKQDNQEEISAFGKQNYGQNSFPSAVFVSLQPVKGKAATTRMPFQEKKCQNIIEENNILKENTKIQNLKEQKRVHESHESEDVKEPRWIHNLIDE